MAEDLRRCCPPGMDVGHTSVQDQGRYAVLTGVEVEERRCDAVSRKRSTTWRR
jgi:hypothetical protein